MPTVLAYTNLHQLYPQPPFVSRDVFEWLLFQHRTVVPWQGLVACLKQLARWPTNEEPEKKKSIYVMGSPGLFEECETFSGSSRFLMTLFTLEDTTLAMRSNMFILTISLLWFRGAVLLLVITKHSTFCRKANTNNAWTSPMIIDGGGPSLRSLRWLKTGGSSICQQICYYSWRVGFFVYPQSTFSSVRGSLAHDVYFKIFLRRTSAKEWHDESN